MPASSARGSARRWTSSKARPTPAGGPLYRPRRPTATPLYPVVQHHLETWLAQSDDEDSPGSIVPAWVERDFRAYLRCGIPAHGFARVRCGDCGEERILAFSCKGRGACPSCNARRMAEVAAHLTDEVLPHLPLRQWVLSLPKRLRPYLHHDPRIASAVLDVFLRALRSTLRRASPGAASDSDFAALSFPQRFGSSLNPHYHFHVLGVDGVFSEASGAVLFHEATALTPEDWQSLERAVQRRVLRLFRKRGLLEDATVLDMLGWQASGGFSVDASVRIEGEDRAGVERLVRYCARPPLTLERLVAVDGQEGLASPDARLYYRLPEGDVQGRSGIVLTPLELLARLAALIPPPRIHRHRYHGVLAPHARLRAAVVRIGREEADHASISDPLPGTVPMVGLPRAEPRPSRIPWAQLLARIYEVLPLLCPACGGEMRVLAFVTEAPTVQAILLHLGLPHRPPPLTPARGPPQAEIEFDQTPAFDPLTGDVGPDFDFDQSVPEDWDAA